MLLVASLWLHVLDWGLLDGLHSVGRVVSSHGLLDVEELLELVVAWRSVEDQGDEEEDQARQWEEDTNDLPATVVLAVVWVGGVLLHGHHDQPVHGPWEHELDGEAPPELEELLNPHVLLGLVEGNHVRGNWSHTAEEHLVVPLGEGDLRHELGEQGRDHDGEDVPGPDDWKTNPGLVGEGEVAEPCEWDHEAEVHEHEGEGSWLGLGHGLVLAEVPADGHGLEDTHQEHEVHVQVVIDDVEEGEAPVEAEEGGEDGTDHAEHGGDDDL